MFNSPEYTSSPYANRSHSIACIAILEDNDVWREVKEVAAVCEPFLKILRWDVSGGKPAAGSIYESITRAKESIRTYYIINESKCKASLDIVDRRWHTRLYSCVRHAAGAYLNPTVQYNPEVKFLGMIKEEFYTALDKLLPVSELRHNLTEQIGIFRKARGMFGSNLAREALGTAAPGIWWEQYGDSAPGLQRVSVRITNQVCSASIYEKSCSSSNHVFSEKHNKLDKDTVNDLPLNSDHILLEDIDLTSDWVEERNFCSNL